MLESIGSARIEGNNTTVAQYVETKIESGGFVNESIQEILNIEEAMAFVDEYVPERGITSSFIKELHQLIVKGLTPPPHGEGDRTPGAWRDWPVQIHGAQHTPPESQQQVAAYMDELIAFIKQEDSPKYDLLKVAIAHHRFMWIHPFGNGNGRTGRLFTYAMLVKQGFNVHVGRMLNPTAVFCIDRNRYNELLAAADTGTPEGMEQWCTYVLAGLKGEIDKIDRLLDHNYLLDKILIPALRYSLNRGMITDEEYELLKCAAVNKTIQNSDLQEILSDKLPAAISRKIRYLKEKRMLEPEEGASRRYHLNFANNFLMRGIILSLEQEGFVPVKD